MVVHIRITHHVECEICDLRFGMVVQKMIHCHHRLGNVWYQAKVVCTDVNSSVLVNPMLEIIKFCL